LFAKRSRGNQQASVTKGGKLGLGDELGVQRDISLGHFGKSSPVFANPL
jgi:hypothetical protein